jgi:hypothetical protein
VETGRQKLGGVLQPQASIPTWHTGTSLPLHPIVVLHFTKKFAGPELAQHSVWSQSSGPSHCTAFPAMRVHSSGLIQRIGVTAFR